MRDDRGVADPDRGGPIDAPDDGADLVHGEWPCRSTWRGAVGAHQSAAYLPDGLGGDGILHAADAVDVSDRGAGRWSGERPYSYR